MGKLFILQCFQVSKKKSKKSKKSKKKKKKKTKKLSEFEIAMVSCQQSRPKSVSFVTLSILLKPQYLWLYIGLVIKIVARDFQRHSTSPCKTLNTVFMKSAFMTPRTHYSINCSSRFASVYLIAVPSKNFNNF